MSKSDMERAEAFFERCSECDGIGEVEREFEFHECKNCKGAGELQPTPKAIAYLIQEVRDETRTEMAMREIAKADAERLHIHATPQEMRDIRKQVRSPIPQTQHSKEGEGK